MRCAESRSGSPTHRWKKGREGEERQTGAPLLCTSLASAQCIAGLFFGPRGRSELLRVGYPDNYETRRLTSFPGGLRAALPLAALAEPITECRKASRITIERC